MSRELGDDVNPNCNSDFNTNHVSKELGDDLVT